MLAYTIAAELGDIARFASPRKLAGYNGLCPRVYQSGERDLRGPLSKQGPRYQRWALVEAATHAYTHPAYRDRYQQTKMRIGKQRAAKVTQIDLARRLAEAIWHMLSRGERFAPKGATDPLAALRSTSMDSPARYAPDSEPISSRQHLLMIQSGSHHSSQGSGNFTDR